MSLEFQHRSGTDAYVYMEGSLLPVGHCQKHNIALVPRTNHHEVRNVMQAVRSEDYALIQLFYDKHHKQLPCFTLDNAISVCMHTFLKGLGATCCHFTRSLLARRILEVNLRSAPRECRGTSLDLAVVQGDMNTINALFDAGAKADISQKHWRDCVVQHYFMDARRKKRASLLNQWAIFPTVIATIVCCFCNDWDDTKESLQNAVQNSILTTKGL